MPPMRPPRLSHKMQTLLRSGIPLEICSPTATHVLDVDLRNRLGKNVKRLRTDKGWSQEDYADRAGIHRTYVSDIERGARNPTITVVEKLAKPLGIRPGILLD